MIYLLIDMPEGRVMVRLGRAAESEFPAPMLRSRMCSTLVDVDVALGPGSVASVVRYGYWKNSALRARLLRSFFGRGAIIV